jgi:ATP-dependent DNA helicase RecG
MASSIDTRLDFLSPVSLVAGLGEKRVAALNGAGISTVGDLLHHFPRRYVDRSVVTPIARCAEAIGKEVNVIGVITAARVERGRRQRLRIRLADDSGSMEALWFAGIPFFRKSLTTGLRVLCTGTVSYRTGVQMIHPSVERIAENAAAPDIVYLPVYPLTLAMKEAGISQKMLRKSVLWALDNLRHYPKLLPDAIEKKRGFPPLDACIREMHLPADPERLGAFRDRLVYEELYRLAATLRWSRRKFALPGRSMKPGTLFNRAVAALPFALTADQEMAAATLLADAAAPTRMHRLLQGDVGSGKTVVAFLSCLPALAEGLQAAWLCPTEILARQTHATLTALLAGVDVSPDILLGETSPDERRRIHRGCADGSVRCVVGTHALLSPQVKFKKLGMIVIDEQHKFGARQRLALAEKDPAADLLVMSATPIPQTLASTLYGDLDVVSILSPPAGRHPVSTHLVPEHKRADMERFILNEIREKGGQAFFVAPRIESDEDSDEGPELRDVLGVLQSLKCGPLSEVESALVHGAMSTAEREKAMARFSSGEVKVLVSTTVIEVGIDVPGATVLVVENAERFGLSQLHQIRGRVGRSSAKSWCFLCANAAQGSLAARRLSYFCSHHNGFEIAEQDMLMRGPGEVAGFRQSGWEELRLADMLRDAALFREIQNDLHKLFAGNPGMAGAKK